MRSVILCIDDLQPRLEVRKANLENLGYSVLVATSGHLGIKILKQNFADAVLLEYKQEGIDAEAVAFQIKQHFPELPVILLSAYLEVPERILWLVDEYVMKSAPLEELVTTIERIRKQSISKPRSSETTLTTGDIAAA